MRKQAYWDEHAQFMDALFGAGKVILGGTFNDDSSSLVILAVESTDVARAIKDGAKDLRERPRAKVMKTKQREELLKILQGRFEKHLNRHPGLEWAKVQAKLDAAPEKLRSLNEMESTGGEPDVFGYDKMSDQYSFYDCSAESPQGRRSLCYDRAALESRKENKPVNNALDLAGAIGIELLTEAEYRALQQLGKFDLKTSSWVQTPADIRKLGGALYCDCRYDKVFVYHNGAESYYAARGFRGSLKV